MKKSIKLIVATILALTLIFSSAIMPLIYAEQVLITEETPLLTPYGALTKPGWCPTNLYTFDRSDVPFSMQWRLKEWDFYQISNDRYTVQVTIADIFLGGAYTVGIFDRETGERCEALSLKLLTLGTMNMCNDPLKEHTYTRNLPTFKFNLHADDKQVSIKYEGLSNDLRKFKIDLTMDLLPDHESLVMAVPFEAKDNLHFYYNQKINCMVTTGTVNAGNETIEFKGKEDNSYCVLDWGRGTWPLHTEWYWGNGSTTLENGDIFGFEIGWGFGNMEAASENTLFINGKAHKVGYLTLTMDDENDYMSDWHFTSDDGRFEMTMTPTFDNYTKMRILGIGTECHQVFGLWNGTVTLDDGTVLEIHDMLAFCEHSDNVW